MLCISETRPPGSFRAGFCIHESLSKRYNYGVGYAWSIRNRARTPVHGRAESGTRDAYVAGIDLGTTNSAIAVGSCFHSCTDARNSYFHEECDVLIRSEIGYPVENISTTFVETTSSVSLCR